MKFVLSILAAASVAIAVPAAAQNEQAAQTTSRLAQAAKTRAAAELAGPSVLALYLAGNTAFQEGRFEEATDFFARGSSAATGEARNSLQERAFQAALTNITRAAQLAPQFEGGAQIIRQQGQLVTAVESLAGGDNAKSLQLLTGNTTGVQYRQISTLLRPWAAAAAGQREQVIATPPARADALTRMNATYNRLMLLEFQGQFDEIEAGYRELAARAPEALEDHYNYSMAAFLERRGRPADAFKVYGDMLKANPENLRAQQEQDRLSARRPKAIGPLTPKQGAANILMAQATLSLAANDPETALQYYWLALRLDERRTDALYIAATIESGIGATASARMHYERIPRNAPEYINARVSIAETWLDADDVDRALAVSRQTVSREPRDMMARSNLATVLAIAGKHKEATTAFTQVIRARGAEASWLLYYQRAMSYTEQGEWNKAEPDLMKALELSPDQPEVMNYLGYMWADRGENLPEALALLQKAVRARPNVGAIVDSLGWAYYRMGDIPKAIEQLERAAELDAADPAVNDHLGDAYLSAGRKLEAVYQWQRVLTLSPDNKLRNQVQTKITQHQGEVIASAAPQAPVTP